MEKYATFYINGREKGYFGWWVETRWERFFFKVIGEYLLLKSSTKVSHRTPYLGKGLFQLHGLSKFCSCVHLAKKEI